MANTFLNATEYANTMLLMLKNNLVMGRLVSGTFKDRVTDQNGLTVSVRKHPQFIAKDGATLAAQSIATGKTTITVDRYKNVHVSVSDLEAVQSYTDLMRNSVMRAAASTLAHEVDIYLASLLKFFPSHVGTIGESIKTAAQAMKGYTRLMDLSVPGNDIVGVMTYEASELIRGALLGGNIQGVNKDALSRARIPVISEVEWYATQHVPSVTTGSRAATGASLVNGAAQNVNYVTVKDQDYQTIAIDGLTGSQTVKAGDIFTIAGVYAYDNRARQALTFLRQFVVMEDAAATTGAIAALKIYPYIIVPNTGSGEADTNSAFATVDAAPADDAAITWLGVASTTYKAQAVWNKAALQMVSARLEKPMSDESSYATDPETGLSIRYWRGSDIATGQHIHRWDMIYGAKNVDPRLGTRISGAA